MYNRQIKSFSTYIREICLPLDKAYSNIKWTLCCYWSKAWNFHQDVSLCGVWSLIAEVIMVLWEHKLFKFRDFENIMGILAKSYLPMNSPLRDHCFIEEICMRQCQCLLRGCSSIGRALAWRARCTGFETLHSHRYVSFEQLGPLNWYLVRFFIYFNCSLLDFIHVQMFTWLNEWRRRISLNWINGHSSIISLSSFYHFDHQQLAVCLIEF